MGIFSRSNSSASSRRSSRLGFSFNPATDSDGLQTSRPAQSRRADAPDTRPHTATKTPVDIANTIGEIHSRSDFVAPTIPMRTSSRDAAVMNSLARTLVSRGRKLKSSASKLSLVSNLSTSSIRSGTSKDTNHGRSTPQHAIKPDGSDASTASISSPSHFQHLTHALPQQFAKIASASHSDLVADFSAMRASQNTRRDFRGIKTVDLHSRTSSVETNTASLTPSEASSSQSSATLSFGSDSSRNSFHNLERSSPLRAREVSAIRPQESFSQPFPMGRSQRPARLPPPPRKSSRGAATQYEDEVHSRVGQDGLSSRRGSDSLGGVEDGPGMRYELQETYQEAADKQADAQSAPLPYELCWPVGDWPLSPYGAILPCVDEEDDLTRSSSPSAGVFSLCERSVESVQQLERPSPGSTSSSSQNSTATLTSRSFAKSPSKEVKFYGSLTSTLPPYQQKSMQRSSLNNGLFTSWSFEDEPLRGQANDKKLPKPYLQDPLAKSPSAASDTGRSRSSRIPVPSAVSAKHNHMPRSASST